MTADPLNWWQIIALLGAVQGVILAIALAGRRSNRTPNRLLAVAVFAFAVHLASVVYYSADLVAALPQFFGIAQSLMFVFGPLFYLYAVAASDRDRRLRAADLWHALPFFVFLAWGLPIYLLPGPDKVALFRAIQNGATPVQAAVALPLALLSGFAYTVATFRLLQRHQQVVAENYSTLERVNLRWLLSLVVGYGAIWLVAIAFEVTSRSGIAAPIEGDFVIALGMTVVIYGIGYWGLRQPEIFRFATAEHAIPAAAAPTAVAAASTQRYERSGLAAREAEKIRTRLVAVMEQDRPYRRCDLTLDELAQQIETSPHRLSEVLNVLLELSFYDFVNGYRVREVQQRLASPDGARYTYLSLALDAGFASKSTFNAAFKKLAGMTPSEYRSTASRSPASRSAANA